MSKNKKILFVSRTLTGGGAERFVSEMTTYLSNKSMDITLLLYEKSQNDYNLGSKVKTVLMPERGLGVRNKIFRIVDMKKIIRDINPDIVIPFIDTVVICAFFATNLHNAKFVYTVRNSPWHEEGTRFSKMMRKVIAYFSSAIMLQNNEQSEYFPKTYETKEFVVPNPVARDFVCNLKEAYNRNIYKIISVGRLDSQKNFMLLLRVMKRLKEEGFEYELQIYGEGSLDKELTTFINDNELVDKCLLMGRSNAIADKLKASDLFIMSSNYEGMPNALIEAMALGVPCISSDCKTGPRSLIINKSNGILFETGNENSLFESCKFAFSNPLQMIEMGKKAREDICSKYTLNNCGACFNRMIEEITK